MRVLMGIIKNSHGVYLARKKVPPALEEAVAQAMSADRPRLSWLQRSLRTKDWREANIRAKPVLMEFDQLLEKAKDLTAPRQHRSELSETDIQRMASYHYASMLEADDELRASGGSEELFQAIAKQLAEAGIEARTPFPVGSQPVFGLSDREMYKRQETLDTVLPAAQAALARYDIGFLAEELEQLLDEFGMALDRHSESYRKLGVAVLRQHVAALQAQMQRHRGEPVETPKVAPPTGDPEPQSDTLRAALTGWKKVKTRPPGTVAEFEHGVSRFVQLHGDLAITSITRRHVRELREALQAIPLRRSGALRRASLQELAEWSSKHPNVPCISPGTVNKLLGAVQAVALWGRDNGLVPDEAQWPDPFTNMRLEEAEPDREPWDIGDLRLLFGSAIYVDRSRPTGGRGEAAYWLPLLGLFTGARLGELASLTVSDITTDEQTAITAIVFSEDEELGRRLKTRSSRRLVPVHPYLERLGFLRYIDERRRLAGVKAAVFPLLRDGSGVASARQWSKWFGRYIRSIGVKRAVFHSFRHGFKDALRAAGENQDINHALTGHSGSGVGDRYGAKEMVRRFGLRRLADAVCKVAYPSLDPSRLMNQVSTE